MITSGSVSVVIPAYNHEGFVGQAVRSVAAQTLLPMEVVVVDDGSTDGTAAVLETLSAPGLSVHAQTNRGAHHALNRAGALATGEYLAILNSDDVFRPHWVEQALGVARATGAALVMGRVQFIDAEGALLPAGHPAVKWYQQALKTRTEAPTLREAVLQHNVSVTTSNFFVHRSLWDELGGFRDYRYVHDLDFLLRALALCPRRVRLEDSLVGVGYRVHGTNTIAEDVDAAMAERGRLLRDSNRVLARGAALLRRPGAARRIAESVASGMPRLSFSRTGASAGRIRCGLVVPRLDEGGLEEIVALLAQGLPTEGLDTSVLCTHGGGAVARRLASAGLRVTVADGSREAWAAWLDQERPDVISSHFVDPETVRALHPVGTPIVETVHNTYAWLGPEGWEAEREKAALVTRLVAVSRIAADYYRRHVPGSAPVVIPNAVHPERVTVVPKLFARRLLGLSPDDKVLVQLGRISTQKNQLALVGAFAQLAAANPSARLILAGGQGDGDAVGRIRSEYAGLLAEGRVLLPGRSDRPHVLLSAADGYVSAALFEGWSVAASEALWAGLPLLLTDCGGSRELVGGQGERGRILPHPLGDPMAVDPTTLRDAAGGVSSPGLVPALEALMGSLPDDAAAERSSWARTHLDPGTMCSAYAGVLRGAVP